MVRSTRCRRRWVRTRLWRPPTPIRTVRAASSRVGGNAPARRAREHRGVPHPRAGVARRRVAARAPRDAAAQDVQHTEVTADDAGRPFPDCGPTVATLVGAPGGRGRTRRDRRYAPSCCCSNNVVGATLFGTMSPDADDSPASGSPLGRPVRRCRRRGAAPGPGAATPACRVGDADLHPYLEQVATRRCGRPTSKDALPVCSTGRPIVGQASTECDARPRLQGRPRHTASRLPAVRRDRGGQTLLAPRPFATVEGLSSVPLTGGFDEQVCGSPSCGS